MRAPSDLSWVALLFCYTAASITSSILTALALDQLQKAQLLRPQHTEKEPVEKIVAIQQDQEPDAQQIPQPSEPAPAPPQVTDTLTEDDALLTQPPDEATAVEEVAIEATPMERPPVLDLRTLPAEEVPLELRVDAYFSQEHVRAFDHSAIFEGCSSVFAVLDAIHPYLETFFQESSWVGANVQSKNVTILKTSGKRGRDGRYAGDSDDSDSDSDDVGDSIGAVSATTTRNWRLPECLDPAEATELVLYPGVDPRTFAPEKIINLDPNAPVFGGIGSPTRTTSGAGSGITGSGLGSQLQRPMSPSMGARRYSYGRSSSLEDDHDQPKPQKKYIVVLPGALILGGVFDVSEGSIYIGRHVRIEPHVYIKGPCIIGDYSTVRSGAYLRGDVVIGRHVVLRGELKNALVMDYAELCHPGYCGDSICGYKSHFGNQVTTANLNLFYNTVFNEIVVETTDARRYNTGRKKIGVVLGDFSQLGCSTVTDPCTLLRPNTIVYALSRLRKGIYGPNAIIKNKPLEHGVLEVAPLRLPLPVAASE